MNKHTDRFSGNSDNLPPGFTIDTLENTSFQQIYSCFQTAFSDYLLDISGLTQSRLITRCRKNNYNPLLSLGLFADKELMGFSLTGIEPHGDRLDSFDIATGLVPAFRGRGFAQIMFGDLTRKLRIKRVNRFSLEVIQENTPALMLYSKAGMQITRQVTCYQIDREEIPPPGNTTGLSIRPAMVEDWPRIESFFDWRPSWENRIEVVQCIPDELDLWWALKGDKVIGGLAFQPDVEWILQLAVDPEWRRQGVASALLWQLAQHHADSISKYKMINVWDEDQGMDGFIQSLHGEIIVRQYEMAADLSAD